MGAAAGWLGSIQLIGLALFGLALLVDVGLRRRSAARRRGVWALAIVVALVLPVTQLAIEATPITVRPGASVLLVMWASGAALLLARLAHGWWRARGWVAQSVELDSPAWQAAFAALRGQTRVELRRSATIDGAISVGVVRPVIVVPDSMLGIAAQERDSLLAHELAHVARADCLMLLLGGVVRALYWIDPLAWLALRELRAQAENAADDAVLSVGVSSSSYAAVLVGLARGQLERAGRVAAAGLRERVVAILDVERARSEALASVPRFGAARVVALAVLLATMTTAACEARGGQQAESVQASRSEPAQASG